MNNTPDYELVPTQTLSSIADAIREKNGASTTYTAAAMPEAIRAIPTGDGSTYPYYMSLRLLPFSVLVPTITAMRGAHYAMALQFA